MSFGAIRYNSFSFQTTSFSNCYILEFNKLQITHQGTQRLYLSGLNLATTTKIKFQPRSRRSFLFIPSPAKFLVTPLVLSHISEKIIRQSQNFVFYVSSNYRYNKLIISKTFKENKIFVYIIFKQIRRIFYLFSFFFVSTLQKQKNFDCCLFI